MRICWTLKSWRNKIRVIYGAASQSGKHRPICESFLWDFINQQTPQDSKGIISHSQATFHAKCLAGCHRKQHGSQSCGSRYRHADVMKAIEGQSQHQKWERRRIEATLNVVIVASRVSQSGADWDFHYSTTRVHSKRSQNLGPRGSNIQWMGAMWCIRSQGSEVGLIPLQEHNQPLFTTWKKISVHALSKT